MFYFCCIQFYLAYCSCTSWSTFLVSSLCPVVPCQLQLSSWSKTVVSCPYAVESYQLPLYQVVQFYCFQSITSCILPTPVVLASLVMLFSVHTQLYLVNSNCSSWSTPVVSSSYPVVPCQLQLYQLSIPVISRPYPVLPCQVQFYHLVHFCCFQSIFSCTLSTPVVPASQLLCYSPISSCILPVPVVPAGLLLLFPVHIQLYLANSSCTRLPAGVLLLFPVHIQFYFFNSSCTSWSTSVFSSPYPVALRQLQLYQLVYSCCFQSISSCTLSASLVSVSLLLLFPVHTQLYLVNSNCSSWSTPVVSSSYPVVPCQLQLYQLSIPVISRPYPVLPCQVQFYHLVHFCCF